MLIYTAAASWAQPQGPLASVKDSIAQTVAILHNTQMPVDERRRQLHELAARNLDLARMAQESMGNHWYQIEPSQRDEFVKLFDAFIEAAYLERIQDYANLNIDVSSEKLVDADHAEVSATVIEPGEEPTPIIFMMERDGNSHWMVYDVMVEGVSMVGNYRAQFDRVIRDRGFDPLMETLRAKQARLAALLGESNGTQ
jgi:phospholipid transport system substrate-binding protein